MFCAIEVSYCVALAYYVILYMEEDTANTVHGYNPLFYEETRELMGLGIVVLWLLALVLYYPERYEL